MKITIADGLDANITHVTEPTGMGVRFIVDISSSQLALYRRSIEFSELGILAARSIAATIEKDARRTVTQKFKISAMRRHRAKCRRLGLIQRTKPAGFVARREPC